MTKNPSNLNLPVADMKHGVKNSLQRQRISQDQTATSVSPEVVMMGEPQVFNYREEGLAKISNQFFGKPASEPSVT